MALTRASEQAPPIGDTRQQELDALLLRAKTLAEQLYEDIVKQGDRPLDESFRTAVFRAITELQSIVDSDTTQRIGANLDAAKLLPMLRSVIREIDRARENLGRVRLPGGELDRQVERLLEFVLLADVDPIIRELVRQRNSKLSTLEERQVYDQALLRALPDPMRKLIDFAPTASQTPIQIGHRMCLAPNNASVFVLAAIGSTHYIAMIDASGDGKQYYELQQEVGGLIPFGYSAKEKLLAFGRESEPAYELVDGKTETIITPPDTFKPWHYAGIVSMANDSRGDLYGLVLSTMFWPTGPGGKIQAHHDLLLLRRRREGWTMMASVYSKGRRFQAIDYNCYLAITADDRALVVVVPKEDVAPKDRARLGLQPQFWVSLEPVTAHPAADRHEFALLGGYAAEEIDPRWRIVNIRRSAADGRLWMLTVSEYGTTMRQIDISPDGRQMITRQWFKTPNVGDLFCYDFVVDARNRVWVLHSYGDARWLWQQDRITLYQLLR